MSDSKPSKIGFGAVDITPPIGLEMTGFSARTEPAEGVHDPLFARLMYVEGQDGPVSGLLLVTLDLIGISQALVGQIKGTLQEKFQVPAERVLLACSHTHGGPATLDHEFLGKHDKAYLATLAPKIAQAAEEAIQNAAPTLLHVAEATAMNAGKNRNVEGGTMDPSVGVLRATDPASGELRGIVLNYTCHPTVLGPKNLLYTADYPYYTNRTVAEGTGLAPERILFTQGACGNINAGHTAKTSMTATGLGLRTYEEAEKLGGNVGKAALEALEKIKADPEAHQISAGSDIPAVTGQVSLDWEPTLWATPEKVRAFQAEKEAILAHGEWNARADASVLLRWSADMLKENLEPAWPPIQANLTAARLGQLTWVAVPGELYSEYGLALKASANKAGQKAWLLGYTNGDYGYYPTQDAFERKDYEAATAYRYYGYPGPFTSEVGEHIGAGVIRLFEEIKK